jgi:phage FluMu protein Com
MKTLRCKHCNKRLLDFKDDINVVVKCNRCKKVNQLSINDNKIIIKDCKIES